MISEGCKYMVSLPCAAGQGSFFPGLFEGLSTGIYLILEFTFFLTSCAIYISHHSRILNTKSSALALDN
jgi:hypothetical protein